MNVKKITLTVLSVFVAVSIGYLVYSETRDSRAEEKNNAVQEQQGEQIEKNTPPGPAEEKAAGRIVRVYYFHSTYRCPTCLKIEEYTKNAVLSNFNQDIRKGTIVWKPVDVELPQNRHFVDDFKLFTKSVVVVDERKGKQVRWKVLDRTWQLVRDRDAFTGYIRDEVKNYLEGA